MLSQSSTLPRLVLFALTLPLAAFSSTAITANGACDFGNCTAASLAAGAIPFGGSNSGNYSFGITLADGDMYTISGSYMNTYFTGTHLGFFPTITYTCNNGNNIPAVAQDTISLDMLQDFSSTNPNAIWDGSYNETIPLILPVAGSSATGNVKYDGQTVGVLGPVFGTGTYTLTGSANLTGLDGTPLVTDYNLTFTFPGGTATPVGSLASSPAPEPVQTIPAALGLVALLAFKTRKSRTGARS